MVTEQEKGRSEETVRLHREKGKEITSTEYPRMFKTQPERLMMFKTATQKRGM